MWPFWNTDTIGANGDTFVHWSGIIGAVIGALCAVVFAICSSWLDEKSARHYEPMGAGEFAFFFPLVLTMALVVVAPVGGIAGWFIGTIMGAIAVSIGIVLVAAFCVASGISYLAFKLRTSLSR